MDTLDTPEYPAAVPELDIDRRQKLAACLLLSAVDLPMRADAAACHLLEAARVCPGVKLHELPDLGPGSRREYLLRAAALIDEMLVEIAP